MEKQWIGVSRRRMRESGLSHYTRQYKNDAILVIPPVIFYCTDVVV